MREERNNDRRGCLLASWIGQEQLEEEAMEERRARLLRERESRSCLDGFFENRLERVRADGKMNKSREV